MSVCQEEKLIVSPPPLSPFTKACMAICEPSNTPCSRIAERHDILYNHQEFAEAVWLRAQTSEIPYPIYLILRNKYNLHTWPNRHLKGLDEMLSLVLDRHKLPDRELSTTMSSDRARLACDLRAEERLLLESKEGSFSEGFIRLKKELLKQGFLQSRRTQFIKHPRIVTLQDAVSFYYTGAAFFLVVAFFVAVVFVAVAVAFFGWVFLTVFFAGGAAATAACLADTAYSGATDVKETAVFLGAGGAWLSEPMLENSPPVPTSMSLPKSEDAIF